MRLNAFLMKNNFFLTFIFLLSILFIIVGLFFYLDSPLKNEDEKVLFTVFKGSSVVSISKDLEAQGLIRSSYFSKLYTKFNKITLKAGTYSLDTSMKTSEILDILEQGKTTFFKVTIPEGLSLKKLALFLESKDVVSSNDFLEEASNPTLLAKYNIFGTTAEGFLFPDTYHFSYNTSANTVVELMLKNFFVKISKLDNLPSDSKTLYNAVILASIIEREYRIPDEAKLISSVFTNRLKIGMGLQSCATIEYIITAIQDKPHPERLLLEDLEIQSDYNTYLWAGLPPTPISNPGLIALQAAFAPAHSEYLYFRLIDPTTGTHAFTKSLTEHVQAGRLLLLKQ